MPGRIAEPPAPEAKDTVIRNKNAILVYKNTSTAQAEHKGGSGGSTLTRQERMMMDDPDYIPVVKSAPKKIGDAVREAREKLGMKQVELARKAQVDLKYVEKLERGEGEKNVENLRRLQRVLKVKLLGDIDSIGEPIIVGSKKKAETEAKKKAETEPKKDAKTKGKPKLAA